MASIKRTCRFGMTTTTSITSSRVLQRSARKRRVMGFDATSTDRWWQMVADEFTFKFAAFVRIGQQLVRLSHRSSK